MNADAHRPRSLGLAVAGLVLSIIGVAGYFVVVLHLGAWLPSVRNNAIPNLILIAIGLALSVFAVVRAARRVVAGTVLVLNVFVAGWFSAVLYIVPALPATAGPPLGAPAPAFALVDQSGKTVRLEDFRGAPVLLVFYRGHW